MNLIALKMLRGERAKYYGLIFGITFATLLMSQQVAIFIGLMERTASQIIDLREADVWVMDPQVQYIDEIIAMPDVKLSAVRSVSGVKWAVPFYKGLAVIKAGDGTMQQVILLGIDDHSLIGAPPQMLHGRLEDIQQPNAMIIDRAGYEFIWPGQAVKLPREIEINDHRVVITGIADASAPFVTFPVVFTTYSRAVELAAKQRTQMSFIIAKANAGVDPTDLAKRIHQATNLQALTWYDFMWRSIEYYLQRTGIPVNFGITVALGFIVGASVAAQTFYIFVLENIRQFGTLKAIGVTNQQILRMVLLQATVVGSIGYSIGIGFCALFFYCLSGVTALRGFYLPWQVALGTAIAVTVIMFLASLVSIRKVFVLDPAVVFRG